MKWKALLGCLLLAIIAHAEAKPRFELGVFGGFESNIENDVSGSEISAPFTEATLDTFFDWNFTDETALVLNLSGSGLFYINSGVTGAAFLKARPKLVYTFNDQPIKIALSYLFRLASGISMTNTHGAPLSPVFDGGTIDSYLENSGRLKVTYKLRNMIFGLSGKLGLVDLFEVTRSDTLSALKADASFHLTHQLLVVPHLGFESVSSTDPALSFSGVVFGGMAVLILSDIYSLTTMYWQKQRSFQSALRQDTYRAFVASFDMEISSLTTLAFELDLIVNSSNNASASYFSAAFSGGATFKL